MFMTSGYYAKAIEKVLSGIKYGSIELIKPNDDKIVFTGDTNPAFSVKLKIKNWKAIKSLILKGDIGLAESYRDGHWEVSDLTKLIELAVKNEKSFQQVKEGGLFGTLFYKLKHFIINQNTRKGSKKNIHFHYDLGNEFFKKWLDPSMTYSSAFFSGNFDLSLEQAQIKKYSQILNQLNLAPQSSILEIGCGWGGFAEYAAKAGHRVKGITISEEQYKFANERIKQNDLTDLVEIKIQDYRDESGKYDAIVSIEMIEAVGKQYWKDYFEVIKNSLKPKGKAIIQAITIRDEDFIQYQKGTDFIQQYIFPGGMLVADQLFREMSQKLNFDLKLLCHFGLDYAETLDRWQKSFNECHDELSALGFDHSFYQIWNFYLSYCSGSFKAGKINVGHFQISV